MDFLITGVVREKESKKPVPGLLIRAFDKDLFFTDVLGNAITASNGTFSLGYESKDFKELFDCKPDIYLNIYSSTIAKDPGRTDDKPIYTTKKVVRCHAGHREHFIIEIPRDQLGEDAPGLDVVTTPEPGEWKDLIDDYVDGHPLDFQYNPDKGFMAPRLKCEAAHNFIPLDENIKVGDTDDFYIDVSNIGNGISYSAYVEIYEGPVGTNLPLKDYQLCDYKILTINPGQKIRVKLSWTRNHVTGRIVGICFDPFMDPRGVDIVDSSHDHICTRPYFPE